MTITLKIRADLARIAASCMAKADVRYYLNGLKIEPRAEGGVFIVGCDGHRFCAVIDEQGTCSEEVILSIDKGMLQRLPKARSSAGDHSLQRLELHDFMGRPALMVTSKASRGLLPEYVTPSAVIEGKYPDWRRMVPKFDALKLGLANAINPQYVQEVLESFSDWETLKVAPYQADPKTVSVWHISGHEHVLLVVMPRDAARGNPVGKLAEKWTGNAIKVKAPEVADPATVAQAEAAAQGAA